VAFTAEEREGLLAWRRLTRGAGRAAPRRRERVVESVARARGDHSSSKGGAESDDASSLREWRRAPPTWLGVADYIASGVSSPPPPDGA